MTASSTHGSLGRLLDVREREVERLAADLANKRVVRERYVDNLQRLERLCADSGASGGMTPLLSLNCGDYKQSVMRLADAHRTDLRLHEADMAVAQRALGAASRKCEALDQVLAARRERERAAHAAREQKRQDETASQMWLRGQA